MKKLSGDIVYDIENQSFIDQMYRGWVLVFSIVVMLPLRWLPFVLPRPNHVAIPVVPIALLLVTCGELVLNNPTISPAGPFCAGQSVQITFTGVNLPDAENIEVFIGDVDTYNPFAGGGTPIGVVPIDYSCSTCPSLLGIMADPCAGSPANEIANEFLALSSGCGFSVSSLLVNYDANNNIGGAQNADVCSSCGCNFSAPSAALIAQLQASSNCPNLINSANASSTIPGGAVVIIFSSNGTPTVNYNFDDLCLKGVEIYILQSSCIRNNGAFTNNPASNHTYNITAGACSDQITYGFDPSYSVSTTTQTAFYFENGTYTVSNNCTNPPWNSVDLPNISNQSATLNYLIPSGLCGTHNGLTNFYISGIVDLPVPCMDVLATPPSSLSISVMCPVVITPAGPFCSSAAPVNLVATPAGGTWSGTGITNGALGTFDPSVATIGNNTVTFTSSTCGTMTSITIVVNCCMTIDPGALYPVQTNCNGGNDGNIVFDDFSGIMNGTGPFTFDWDCISCGVGNDIYSDDGLNFIDSIPAGTYAIIVTDASGCSASATVDVENAPSFNITTQVTNPSCFGSTNGGIQITSPTVGSEGPPWGPSGTWVYDWDNTATVPNDDYDLAPLQNGDDQDILTGLAAGTYNLTITVTGVGYSCVYTNTFVLTQPTIVTVTSPDVAIACFGNTTSITAAGGGGTPGYIYNWSNIAGVNNPATNSPVGVGSYTITVTDTKGCSAVDVVNVTQPASALSASATGSIIACNDGTGTVSSSGAGGTSPYTYAWSNGPTTQNQIGLFAGTYTVTVTDANLCTATAIATVSVSPPTLVLPPPDGTTVACVSSAQTAPIPPPTNNSCGNPENITGPAVSADPVCSGIKTYTYTYTDPATGNNGTWVYTYTINDNVPPTASNPAPITVSCGSIPVANPAVVTDEADNCSGAIVVAFVGDATSGTACAQTVTRTYSVTDACGNAITVTQLITVNPPALPTMTAPAATTVACGALPSASTIAYTNGLAGGCLLSGTSNPSTFTATPGTCGGTVTETWTATDACGRALAPVTRTITVSPAALPTMTAPGATTVACGALPASSTIPFTNGLGGGCLISGTSNASTFSASPGGCGGTVTETWTATDACGRALAPVTRTITVSPAALPTMTAPGATTVACGAIPAPSTIAFTNGLAGACLINGTSNPSTFSATPSACGGTVTETWTATDACGRALAPVTRTITVSPAALPTMTAPGATTVACGALPASSTIAYTNGLAGGCLLSGTSNASTFTATPGACGGTVTETWTATDACGRALAPVTRTITVSPAALPTMTPPGATTVACGALPAASTIAYTNGLAGGCLMSGTSNASTFSATPGACGGTVTETWTATDACGRALAPVTRTITVSPAALPTMTAPGATTVACSALPASSTIPFTNGLSGGCLISGTSNASTFSVSPGGCGGTVTETWTATDACGRALTPVTRTITVSPAALPTMTAPGATTVACGAIPAPSTIAYTNGLAGACLISGTSNASTFTATPGACGGTVTETWTATDACGRPLASVSRIITVSPAALPTMTAPGATTVACGALPSSSTIAYTNGLAGGCLLSGTSNASTFTATPGGCGGTVTETWTATDACGRALASVSRIITVSPAALPTMTAPGATTVACAAIPAPSTIAYTNGLAGACLISGTSNTSTFTATPGACGGTVTETWTATDLCGRPLASVSRVITVSPAALPTMTAPGAITVACGALPAASTIAYTNGLSGGCLISGTSNASTFSAVPGCGGPVTETWTATDACGRPLASVSRIITINPATLPTMTAPGATTVACGALPSSSTIPYTNGLTGGCLLSGTSNSSTFTATPGACGGTVTETWTATDACGRPLAPVSRTITVSPAALPTMTAPGATTVACGALPSASTIAFTNGLAGGCLISGTSNASTFTATPGACGGTVTETWTATDACGRPLASVSRTITVSPAALPTMTAPGPITVACNAIPAPSTIAYTNGLSGGCLISGTSNASTFSVSPGGCGGTVTETWTATDACGRPLALVTRVITVDPGALPTMTAPGAITVACNAIPAPSTIAFTNGLTGACLITGTSNASTFSATPGACGGTVTETWTATDPCGRPLASVSRMITVSPATLPTMTAPGATTVACGALPAPSTIAFTNGLAGGCLISGTSNASTFTATPGGCGGTVTETWTATDACGRPLTPVTRTITVSPAALPTMTAPGGTTIACGVVPVASTIAYTNGLSGSCLISGTSNASTFSATPGACGGTITETWTATDPCGRPLAAVTRIITVDPAALPTMTAPGTITVACGSLLTPSTIAYTNGLAGGCLISGTSNPSTFSSIPGCGGPVTETWTATDPCGRPLASVSRIITVDPAALPTMTAPGAATVACGALPSSSTLPYTNGLTGGCLLSGTSNPSTFTATPGACGGTVTETWTATDVCGRPLASVSRIITISPAALPAMTAPGATTVACGALPSSSTIAFTNGLAGGCLISGTSDASTFTATPGACGGTVTETWTATDACGRPLASVSRTITVSPAALPTMTAPGPINVACTALPVSSTISYTNGLAGSCLISGTSNPSTFSALPGGCGGTVTETWTATDACGRPLAPVTRVITIDPPALPSMTSPGAITVACGAIPAPSTLAYTNGLTGACLVSGTSNASTFSATPNGCGGTVTETWTATDACGRPLASVSRIITVDPAALPTMTAPGATTVACGALPAPSTIPYTNGLTGSCLISGTSDPSTFTATPGGCGGTVTETWTATDACGRPLAPVSRTITISPAALPTMTAPGATTVACGAIPASSTIAFTNGLSGACLISGTSNASTFSATPGACGGTVTETWTATDACSRPLASVSRVITVSPAALPTMTAPGATTVACGSLPAASTIPYTNGLTGGCLISGTSNLSTFSAVPGCGGPVTETWTATDLCGRPLASVSRVITVSPAALPTMTSPGVITVACNAIPASSTIPYTNGLTGGCLLSGTSNPSTFTAAPGACGGTITETWTATDACGRPLAQVTRVITVDPATLPTMTAPGVTTVACGALPAPSTIPYTNGLTGSCLISGTSDPSTFTATPGGCGGTVTETWTATDPCGRPLASVSRTITVSPAVLPTMTAPGAINVACNAIPVASTIPYTNGLSGSCLISGTSNPSTFTVLPGGCGGTVTETWTATDACGRPLAPVSRVITIDPPALPTMTAPGATTVACGAIPAPSTIAYTNGLSGSCLVSGTSNPSTFSATPGGCGGTVTETWTATDACGRPLAPVTRVITVDPAALPTMTALGATTVACNTLPASSTIPYTNGLSGACLISGTSDPSTFSATPGACGGTVTETWTATDACGRPLAPVTRIITVDPAALPTMTAPGAITVACSAIPASSTIPYTNGLSGACLISGTSNPSTFSVLPGGCGGTVTETWTATDACGRPLAQVTRVITIDPPALPTMTAPGATTVACSALPAPSTIPYTNGLSGACLISGTSNPSTFSAAPSACGGTVTETWTATDACGRPLAPVTRIITVSPATLPTMAAPGVTTVACGALPAPSTIPYTNGLSGACLISGTSNPSTFTAAPGGCGGTVTETWTATDACGRPLATVTRIITVDPAALPTMTAPGATTVACNTLPAPSTIPYTNGLSGACLISGTSNPSTFSASPGGCGGTVTETWTATDACGRPLAPVTRTITVSPAALPTMTAPGATTVACSALPAPTTIPYTNGLSGACLISGTSNPSTFSAAPGGCGGTVTETWTATDACGRPLASVSRTITVSPAALPTMTAPGASTVACGAIPAPSTITYTNGLSGACLISGTSDPSTFTATPGSCGGTVTETWTATDACGRPLAPVTRVITVDPAVLPTMTASAATTVACGALPAPSTIPYTNGLSGACLVSGTSNVSTFSAAPGACGGTVTETWTATDACGRPLTPVTRVITVDPAALPTMTAPGDITAACSALPAPSTLPYSNGLSGACLISGTSDPSTFTVTPGGCGGTVTETWTATDVCGRPLAPVTRVITVSPGALPNMTAPAATTVACGALPAPSTIPYSNGLIGGCLISGTSDPSTFSATPGACGGTVTETWTATDACGRPLTPVTRVITVDPATLPTMTAPAASTVACGTLPAPSTIPFTNGLSGGCLISGTSNPSTFSAAPGACGGTVTETWTAADACGRPLAPVTRIITVDPAALPTMTPPGTITIACNALPAPSTIPFTNGLSGGCLISGTSDPSTFTVSPGGCGGTVTETWTATDACGRSLAPVTRVITVDPAALPAMTAPGALTVACNALPAPTTIPYTNGLSGACLISGTSNPSTFSATPGACGGTVTETWTATDACGRPLAPVTRIITVDPAIIPTMIAPASTTVACGAIPTPTTISYSNGLSGACLISGTSDPSTFSAAPGACGGTVTETWTATDACGRPLATVTRVITVDPATLPTMTSPAATTVACGVLPAPSTISYSNALSGACLISGTSNVSTFSATPGACGGTVTETWTATDACGRPLAPVTRVITVDPATLPTMTAPGAITAACSALPAPSTIPYTNGLSGSCLISGTSDPSTFTATPGGCGGTITETWTATDACGRPLAPVTRVITVDPGILPTMTAPAATTIACGALPAPSTIPYTNGLTGPCLISGTSDPSTFTATPGACGGTVTETWTATDACGRPLSSVSRVITVDPAALPTMTAPGVVTVACGALPVPSTIPYSNGLTGACLINGTSNLSTFSATPGGCGGTITETWTATDACGRPLAPVTRVITVDPAALPFMTAPGAITAACDALPAPSTIPYSNGLTGSCLISGISDPSTFSVAPGGCGGTITETWTATDACGRPLAPVTRVITVDPGALPTMTAPAATSVACNSLPAPSTIPYTNGLTGGCLVSGTSDLSTFSAAPGACGGTVTETWTATDACGRPLTPVSRIITIDPAVLPTLTAPGTITLACGALPAPSTIPYTNGLSGPCLISGTSDPSTFSATPGGCGGTITETWTATDACGRPLVPVTRVITVDPASLPAMTPPGTITVACDAFPAPSTLTYTNNETGTCLITGTSNPSTFSAAPGTCGGPVTETWTGTDACGRPLTPVTRLITVDPAPLPTMIAMPDITINCDVVSNPSTIAYTNGLSGGCLISGTSDPSTFVTIPGSCPGNFTLTETWTATDACGRPLAPVSRTITAQDITPPTASNPVPFVVSGCNMPVPPFDISVVTDETDNCSLPITVAFDNDATSLLGCLETTIRTYSVTDACGNSISVAQTITRTLDNTPPVLSAPPANVTVNCVVEIPPIASLSYTDNCSPGGTVAGTQTGPSGSPLTVINTWTITDACGNTSTETQTITILEALITNSVSAEYCEGGSVVVYGVSYNSPGVYLDTIPSITGGCDTAVTINISELFVSTTDLNDNFCQGGTYTLPDGSTTTIAGSFGPYIFMAANGCDSLVNVDLAQFPSSTGNETYSGCVGDGYSVVVNGTIYNELHPSGTETLINSNGCDSTVTILLTFASQTTGNENYSGCQGDGYSVVVNGTTYNEGNPNGTETLTGISGCDSIVTINLVFNTEEFGNETYNGCEGDGYSVVVNGTTYNESNPNGTEVLMTSGGCDSTVTISLFFASASTGNVSYDGCQGDGFSVVVNGTVYNEAHPSGTEILTNSVGCDSTVTINLVFSATTSGTETYSGCIGDGYSVIVNGTTYNESNPSGTETFPGASGCDSTVTINLTFAAPGFGSESYSGCVGDGYSVIVNGTIYNESNPTGTEIFAGPNGCDTTVTINLVFNINLTGNETYLGCEGDGYSVIVNGTLYNESNPTGTETLVSSIGCDSIVTIDLTFLPLPVVQIDPVGPVCTDAGVITLTASPPGGSWSGSVSSNQFDPNALGVGSHQVIYTVTQGTCQSNDNILVNVYQLSLSCQAVTNESAPGANDGVGQVTVSGGLPPYDIQWTNSVVSGSVILNADGSFTINSLGGGVYTVQVQDASVPACITTCQFVITSNIPCTVVIDNIDVQDASCAAIDNGAASIDASGGVPPYEYSLDGINYQLSNVFPDLMPGPYTAYVRDFSGCVDSLGFQIGVGPGPVLNIVDITNSSCGVNNGSISVDASGGSLPYTYSIDGINYVLSGVFPGLNAGNYQIYLLDNAGCGDTIQATVIADGAPIIDNIITTNANCGQSNGSITIVAHGGQGILVYSIDGINFQASPVFNNRPAGTYPVTAQDETGCFVTGSATIQNTNGPTINPPTLVLTSCGQNDGKITINATGVPTLMYSINGINYFTSNMFSNLAAGNYTLYVKDGNGCIASQPVVLNTTNGPQLIGVVVTHTQCGNDIGSITVNATGGTGNLEYFFNGVSNGNDNSLDDLPAGDYDIEVIDDNNCSVTDQVTIDPSVGPDFDVYITPAHCGRPDGTIELDGFDGIPPYTYSINGGPFTPIFTFPDHISDFYNMRIKDASGCIYEEDVFLWEIDGPIITDVITTNPACGQNSGTIEVTAFGSSPLHYSKALPFYQDTNNFTNVNPGTYTITVKDDFGCTDTAIAVISPTPKPTILSIDTTGSQCGMSTGILTVHANGGTPPLMYSLNNGPFGASNVFSSLASGTYIVKVKGANLCEDIDTAVITSIGAHNSTVTDVFCSGDSYQIAGNTYTSPGMYTITLPNGSANGCDSIIHLTLSEDPLKTKTLFVTICEGDVYTINGMDYSMPGIYLIDTIPAVTGCDTIWSLDLTVDPLLRKTIFVTICANEVYTINGIDYSVTGVYPIDTVPAAVGCDTIRTLDLTVNPLEATTLYASICTGEVYSIGGMDYSVTGQYLIDTIPAAIGCDSIRTLDLTVSDYIPGDINASICQGDTFTINGMDYTTAGQYVVDTIVNPVSCDTIRTLHLTVDPLPLADAGIDQILDCNVISVILNGAATGGTPHWTGPDINAGNQNLLTPSVTIPGTYYLTVTSPNNCIAIDSAVVTLDPSTVVATAVVDTFLSCDIDTVVLQAGPLGPEYTYQWTGPDINASNEHLANPIVTIAGLYSLVVTNTVTNCISSPADVLVEDKTTNIVAIIQDPTSLTCFSTFVNLNTTGSSSGPNIAYIWFDEAGNIISTSPFIQVTSGGMFMFMVIDTISGCYDDTSVLVQNLQEYPPVDAGEPQQLDCDHNTVTLNEGATNNLPNIIFHWDGPPGGILSSPDLLSVLVGTAGQYILTAMDTLSGCTNPDTVQVADMTQLPFAEIELVEQFTCLDNTAMIDIGSSEVGPDIYYEWNGPLTNGVTTTTLEPTEPGMYYLTVLNQATGCSALDSILLELPDIPTGVLVDVSIPLCEGDASGSLLVNDVVGGTPVYTYFIDGIPVQTSPLFEDLVAGTYSLLVTDANGCTYEEAITVPEGDPLTINIGGDIELELGDSIQLSALINLPWSQIDSIVWSSGDHLSCTHCIDPTLYGLINEIISASVYAGMCADTDRISVRVNVEADVYIPNVFSPNGDSKNDHVTVYADSRVRRIIFLEIFDRWGNQVFKALDFLPNDPQLGWDGTFKNRTMNPGVFAYVAKVELINGAQLSFKGDVTLLR